MEDLYGKRYMDDNTRLALKNAARVARRLQSDEVLSPKEIIEELRKPLPPRSVLESDQAIRADYDHYVLQAGVSSPYRVVTYDEAAELTGKSHQSLWAAASQREDNENDPISERTGTGGCPPRQPPKVGRMGRFGVPGCVSPTQRHPQKGGQVTDRIIRPKELREILGGVSKSTLWRWISKEQFPRPMKLGERAVGWRQSTINEWLDSRPAA